MSRQRSADQDRLDAWLASSQPPPVPAQLRQAILRSAQAAGMPAAPSWRDAVLALWHELGGLRIAAPVMALALAIGMGAAQQLWTSGMQNDNADDLLALALIDDGYSALLSTGTPP